MEYEYLPDSQVLIILHLSFVITGIRLVVQQGFSHSRILPSFLLSQHDVLLP